MEGCINNYGLISDSLQKILQTRDENKINKHINKIKSLHLRSEFCDSSERTRLISIYRKIQKHLNEIGSDIETPNDLIGKLMRKKIESRSNKVNIVTPEGSPKRESPKAIYSIPIPPPVSRSNNPRPTPGRSLKPRSKSRLGGRRTQKRYKRNHTKN